MSGGKHWVIRYRLKSECMGKVPPEMTHRVPVDKARTKLRAKQDLWAITPSNRTSIISIEMV